MKRGTIKLPPSELRKSRAPHARKDELIGVAAFGTTAAVAATVSTMQVVMVVMVTAVIAMTTSYVVTTSVDRGRISELENAPPVEGGNQTAIDELQEQLDDLQDQNNIIVAALMDIKQMISEIFFLIAGEMWTSELKTGVYSEPGFLASRQMFISTGFVGEDSRSHFAMAQFFGAAPMWNVSTNLPFVTTEFTGSPVWFEPVITAHGILLENGTYSVTIDVGGTANVPAGRTGVGRAWFIIIPLSDMTTLGVNTGTVDFMSDTSTSDIFTTNMLYGNRIAEHTWSVGNAPGDRFATMGTGLVTAPPGGGHLHYVIFWRYLNYWGSDFDIFKVNLAKFETALP